MAATKTPSDRWAWVEVDLGAIRRNTRAFKNLLKPGVQLMCAVKADGYGHGAVASAKAMISGGANQFAVATLAEGIQLRQAGISAPILILSQVPPESIDTLLEYDIMPSVFESEFALAYGERAVAADKIGKYHFALDTGMNRVGVPVSDALELRHAIDFHRGLECAGTFTHFATAETPGDWDFELQVHNFRAAIDELRLAGYDTGLIHCDNTPATILHPELHFDMCRVGIGLYGLHASPITCEHLTLEPAMSVRARVVRVVNPKVGMGVGYDMTWRVPKANYQVATIPLGYADGLSRELSNKMDVLVGGRRVSQVGLICMDQCMFAVEVNTARRYQPSYPVQVGDVVTILGRDGQEEITADELAQLRNTINYEVVCDFSQRLEKIYV